MKSSDQKTKRPLLVVGMLLFTLLLIGLDQVTKKLAVLYLKGQKSIPLIPHVFELQYLENRGAAFGMLQNRQAFFILLTLAFLCVVFYFLIHIPKQKRYRPFLLSLLILSAGAIGNFIDRLRQQYVVDFFYFSAIDFPIFNVADIYVTCSVIFLLLLFLFYYKEEDFSFLTPHKDDAA